MNPITRRSFIQIAAGILLTSAQVLRAALQRFIPNHREDEAVARGKTLGIGAVQLQGPRSVVAYSYQTWTICYTAAHLRDLAPQGFNVCIGESAILPSFSKIPKHGLQDSILSYGADN